MTTKKYAEKAFRPLIYGLGNKKATFEPTWDNLVDFLHKAPVKGEAAICILIAYGRAPDFRPGDNLSTRRGNRTGLDALADWARFVGIEGTPNP